MDRRACLALACALAAHALVALAWPQAALRESASSHVAAEEAEVEAGTPEAVPVEVAIVLLSSSDLAADVQEAPPEVAAVAPGRAARSSREHDATRDSQPTGPTTRPEDRADDAAVPPEAISPGGSLRMRGSRRRVDLDPRAGSGLQAAIDGAASAAPAPHARNDLLGNSAARPAERSRWRDSGNGTKRATGEPFEASIAADGTIAFRDRPNVRVHGLGGSFDATDAVMAGLGEVLYSYRKLELMDQSREMRAGMAASAKGQALEASLAGYPRRLNALWRDSQYTLAQRKQLLFALWDECAESGDANVMATARSIRASTLAFIRKVLPADAPGAYTDAELAELNSRRQSAAPFEPYPP